MDQSKQPGIRISQIFLETAEFGHRPDALRLPPSTSPNVGDVDVTVQLGDLSNGEGGAIRIEVRTKPENNPTYHFRVSMIALVQRAENAENMAIMEYLQLAGPGLLYPFVRETIANLTIRGRFGPIWLNPLNLKGALAGSGSTKKKKGDSRKKTAKRRA